LVRVKVTVPEEAAETAREVRAVPRRISKMSRLVSVLRLESVQGDYVSMASGNDWYVLRLQYLKKRQKRLEKRQLCRVARVEPGLAQGAQKERERKPKQLL